MILTRQQRERLVLDLYNQGKNTREIAQEVRMSFSAIGAILKKAERENETSKEQTDKMSQAAQAYELFSDGKSPVDVAIALNLRQTEVTDFYREGLLPNLISHMVSPLFPVCLHIVVC